MRTLGKITTHSEFEPHHHGHLRYYSAMAKASPSSRSHPLAELFRSRPRHYHVRNQLMWDKTVKYGRSGLTLLINGKAATQMHSRIEWIFLSDSSSLVSASNTVLRPTSDLKPPPMNTMKTRFNTMP
jgi:hypothetical protein